MCSVNWIKILSDVRVFQDLLLQDQHIERQRQEKYIYDILRFFSAEVFGSVDLLVPSLVLLSELGGTVASGGAESGPDLPILSLSVAMKTASS